MMTSVFDRRNAMEWKPLRRDSFNQLRMTILRLTVLDHSAFGIAGHTIVRLIIEA